MSIHVELFGIPRKRAGVHCVDVDGGNLREVFQALDRVLPQLQGVCLDEGRLKPGYLANINGNTFVTDEKTPLVDGDSVLILSADAGG